MTTHPWCGRAVMSALALTMVMLVPVQAGQTTTDSGRLDRLTQDLRTELLRAEERPAGEAARFVDELERIRDEVGYLRVSQRRGQRVQETQVRDLELRLQNVRRDMRSAGRTLGEDRVGSRSGDRIGSRSGDRIGSRGGDYEIPAGTELDVRLQNRLYSDTAMVEDRFEATTVVELNQGNGVIVPAGTVLGGVVTTVDRASRTDRRGSLTVMFDKMTVRGRTYDIRATVTEAIESSGIKGELPRIGAGAGVGAIIGGILGGVKGALAGILIGAGGTVLATEGKDVDLPPGTVLRIRFESPVHVDRV